VGDIFSGRKSVGGYEWVLSSPEDYKVAALVQTKSISDIVARILVSRNISPDDADDFLDPKLKNLLPDPFLLKDMDKAATRLARAVDDGETIGIFGDYDVDGATSSAILHRFLSECGVKNVSIHIPDRGDEGYGLSEKGIDKLSEAGATLIVAVDCGITAHAAVDYARSKNIDIIVADHHEAESSVPNAAAVVDPKRIDDDSGLDYLAACGVVFQLCVATNKTLREDGYFIQRDMTPPDLLKLLDLVAFGTVCDVVPLIGANRAFVVQGLKVLWQRQNEGIKTLCDISAIREQPTTFHLGYVLGPRINAGGRVGDSSLGAKLLTTRDKTEALIAAQKLDNYNTERKAVEEKIANAAILKAEEAMAAAPERPRFLLITGTNWHTGVIGIIAGRIKERFNLPTLVGAEASDGVVSGSARSIPGIDIGSAIIRAKEEGILTEGGGHMMAAGFALKSENLEKFRAFLDAYIARAQEGKPAVPTLAVDSLVDIAGITQTLMKDLARLEPFGSANDEPRFVIPNAKITGADAINGTHVKCYLRSDNGKSISAISYRTVGTPLGEALLNADGERFALAGFIKLHEYNGRKTLQFNITDAMEL